MEVFTITIGEHEAYLLIEEYKDLPQCERILKYMRKHGSISTYEAMTRLGIYRLASRINDLKRRGYIIEGKMESGKNRFGENTSFKVYRLVEKEGNTDDQ